MKRYQFLPLALAFVVTIDHAAPLTTVQVYRDPLCSCCGRYVDYLRDQGLKVEVISVVNTSKIDAKYGVPAHLQGCHTSVVNGYAVVGHVPIGAIKKLIDEGRPIKGIALPGMPTQAPGMGVAKPGTLTIYEIPEAGQTPKVFSVE